jgi:branched-chain amino acid transport system substrate-binding protein
MVRKRRVCAGLVAAGLLALAGCGGGAAKPTGPIKVGFILPLTGVFAANAQDERDGWNLALKDAGGSVAGRKIQTIFVDDASDPNQGLTDARQLVQTQKVDVLIGPIAANVGLAIRGFVASSGIPTLYPSACSVELATTEKTPNLILTGWTCDQPTLNFGKYVCDTLGYKHLTTVAMDYAFGWQVTGGFVSSYTGAGCRIDKQIWAPFNATDYSPYVSQIPQDTQAVFDLAAGSAAVRFTQAYQAFGLKGKIPLVGGGTLTDYSAMRSESPESVLGAVTVLQYADGLDTPANKAFVQEYHGATGKYPSYYAESAYATAKLLIAALKKLNGDTSDRKALVNAFKTTPFDAPRGPVKIDPATNSPIQNIYIRRVEMVNGVLRNVVVDTIKQSPPWGPLPRSRWEVQAAHYGRTG